MSNFAMVINLKMSNLSNSTIVINLIGMKSDRQFSDSLGFTKCMHNFPLQRIVMSLQFLRIHQHPEITLSFLTIAYCSGKNRFL